MQEVLGEEMKFRDIILYDFLADKKPFKPYIKRDIKNYYIVIEFTEKDCAEIYNNYSKVMTKEILELVNGSYNIVGNDNFLYSLTQNGLNKTDKSINFNLLEQKHYIITNSRRYHKHNKLYDKSLIHKNESHIAEQPTLNSDFKKYLFISKENNMAINYRFKKSQGDNSPLFIYLHGGNGLGSDNRKPLKIFKNHGLDEKLLNRECSVLIPQAPYSDMWNGIKPVNYLEALMQLIELLCKENFIDKNRIYVTGTSFGGVCTWKLIAKYPEFFACAIPVMGAFANWKEYNFELLKSVPIWIAHSSDDKTVEVEPDDECYNQLKKVSAPVKYTRWDEFGHGMSGRFYKTEPWVEWMFNQDLNKR